MMVDAFDSLQTSGTGVAPNPKSRMPYVYTATMIVRMPMAFIHSPRRTMSITCRRPEEKAMAFGGVDTGSTKAREHAKAEGTTATTYIRQPSRVSDDKE